MIIFLAYASSTRLIAANAGFGSLDSVSVVRAGNRDSRNINHVASPTVDIKTNLIIITFAAFFITGHALLLSVVAVQC